MASDEKLISRDEVLGGLAGRPTKQANTLLALIENRTAYLVAQSRQEAAQFLTPAAVEERNAAYLQAIALNREPPVRPTIQQLEHFAPQWAILVAANPTIRAGVAQLLAQKYTFTYQSVPGIRAALGLDTAAVQEAYQRLYDQPLETIFAPRSTWRDRLGWSWTRLSGWLESLPPFWVAFGLTLPIGPGLLALPIAVADIGPIPAMVLLIVFGLINMLTVAALSEALARSGIIRYGLGFLGQMVNDYLGRTGSFILSVILLADLFLVLIAFYIGISATLADTTLIPAPVWIGLLFGVGLYFLSRKSLNTTIASTLFIGAINTVLVVLIPVLALPQLQPANLAYLNIPFVGDRPFDPAIVRLIFGVILASFFSHLLVANYARSIIRRDESTRSLTWGSVAAIAFTIVVSCLWVLVVNGSIAPEVLARQAGTALAPLAAQVGAWVNVLGSIFVLLSLGMASIHISLGLFFLTQERLPSTASNRSRFWIALSPVVVVFLLAEWLALTGQGSFTGLLSFLGVVALSLFAGVFPALLVVAGRRKGELIPGVVYRLVGQPWLMALVYLVFMASIFLHGLLIWENPLERAGALIVGVVMLVATIDMARRGAFAPRLVVELRAAQTDSQPANLAIVDGGQPAVAAVRLGYTDGAESVRAATLEIPKFSSLRFINFRLPSTQARELKIWTHRLTPAGDDAVLPALTKLSCHHQEQEFELGQLGGQVIVPLTEAECQVDIRLKYEE